MPPSQKTLHIAKKFGNAKDQIYIFKSDVNSTNNDKLSISQLNMNRVKADEYYSPVSSLPKPEIAPKQELNLSQKYKIDNICQNENQELRQIIKDQNDQMISYSSQFEKLHNSSQNCQNCMKIGQNLEQQNQLNQELLHENDILRTTVTKQATKITRIEQELSAQKSNSIGDQYVESLKKQANQLEKDAILTKEKRNVQDKIIEELKSELLVYKSKKSFYEEKINSQIELIQQLKCKKSSFETDFEREIAFLKQEMEKYKEIAQEQQQMYEEQVQNQNQEMDDFNSEKENYEQQIQDLLQNYRQMQDKWIESQKQLEQVQQDLEEQNNEISQLTEQKDELQIKYQEQISQFQQQLQQQENLAQTEKLSQLQEENKNLQEEKDQIQQNISTLQSDINQKQNQLKSLETEISQLKHHEAIKQQVIEELEQENNALSQEKQQIEDQIKSLKSQLATLQQEKTTHLLEIVTLKTTISKNQHLTSENQLLTTENTDLKTNIYDLNRIINDLEAATNTTKTAETHSEIESQALHQKISYLNQTTSLQQQKITALSNQLQTANFQLLTLKKSLESASLENLTLKTDQQQLITSLQTSQANEQSFVDLFEEKNPQELESENAMLSKQLEALKTVVSEAVNTCQKQQEKLEKRNGQMQNLTSQNRKLQLRVADLENENEVLRLNFEEENGGKFVNLEAKIAKIEECNLSLQRWNGESGVEKEVECGVDREVECGKDNEGVEIGIQSELLEQEESSTSQDAETERQHLEIISQLKSEIEKLTNQINEQKPAETSQNFVIDDFADSQNLCYDEVLEYYRQQLHEARNMLRNPQYSAYRLETMKHEFEVMKNQCNNANDALNMERQRIQAILKENEQLRIQNLNLEVYKNEVK